MKLAASNVEVLKSICPTTLLVSFTWFVLFVRTPLNSAEDLDTGEEGEHSSWLSGDLPAAANDQRFCQ